MFTLKDQFKVDISTTIIDGRLESFYCVFRQGLTANETIKVKLRNNIDAFVDIDKSDIPIALQFSPPIWSIEQINKFPKHVDICHMLFYCAVQLVNIYRLLERNENILTVCGQLGK